MLELIEVLALNLIGSRRVTRGVNYKPVMCFSSQDSLSNCLKKFAAVGQQVTELEEFVSSVLHRVNGWTMTRDQYEDDVRKRTQTFRAFAMSLFRYFVVSHIPSSHM